MNLLKFQKVEERKNRMSEVEEKQFNVKALMNWQERMIVARTSGNHNFEQSTRPKRVMRLLLGLLSLEHKETMDRKRWCRMVEFASGVIDEVEHKLPTKICQIPES